MLPDKDKIDTTAFRLHKIIGESKSLEAPAALYLRKQCGFMPDSRQTPFLLRHTLLADYAHRGGAWPALIVKALNEETGYESAEVIFVTFEGDLAPLPAPRLLIGALAGASTIVRTCAQPESFLICLRIEDALRLAPEYGARWHIAAALRKENILGLPILREARSIGMLLHLYGLPSGWMEDGKLRRIIDELEGRGFCVVVFDDMRKERDTL